MSEIQKRELDRRALVKGAAWSAPVLAAAVATPLAAATIPGGPKWDVGVGGVCEGRFNSDLLPNFVKKALALLGYKSAKRYFTISVLEGPLPQDTYFTLHHGGLLNLALLSPSGILNATIIGIDALTAQVKIPAGTPQGSTLTIDMLGALIDISALSTVTLSLNGSDNPSNPANAGANSATVKTLAGGSVSIAGFGLVTLQLCG